MTLIELVAAFTILLVLSVMSLPVARLKVRTERERDLRNALKELRTAIDKYKDNCDQNYFGPPKVGSDCYPESLEILVEGARLVQDPNGIKMKFLRHIPKDPITGRYEWGMRNVQDDPKSKGWGGGCVFDVYTKSDDKAADGTPYADW